MSQLGTPLPLVALGAGVLVSPHATLGSAAYHFGHVRFGRVTLGDDVRLGEHCAVDPRGEGLAVPAGVVVGPLAAVEGRSVEGLQEGAALLGCPAQRTSWPWPGCGQPSALGVCSGAGGGWISARCIFFSNTVFRLS